MEQILHSLQKRWRNSVISYITLSLLLLMPTTALANS